MSAGSFYDINLIAEIEDSNIDFALGNLSESIKSIIAIEPGTDPGFIYYTLPIWHYGPDGGEGSWLKDYPQVFLNDQVKDKYIDLFKLVDNGNIRFSFSKFVARRLRDVPAFLEINFKEDAKRFVCSHKHPDTVFLDLPKGMLEWSGDPEDFNKNFNEPFIEDFIKECSNKLHFNESVNDPKFILSEFYKFLCAYNKYFENLSQLIIISSKLYRTNTFIKSSEKQEDVSFGGLIMALSDNDRLSAEQKMQLSFVINLKYREIAIEDWINKLNSDLKRQTIKSAITAIMSRNMSHNLGSHVITNTKHQIEKLATEHPDPLSKQLNGISKLLHYLQERQDFVAVIANDEKFAKGPLNFKSAVFDMIAIDGPAIRHRSDNERTINNYVLDNIVRSEGIYRKDSMSAVGAIPIEIQMVKKHGDKWHAFKSLGENDSTNDKFNDIILSVPYGLNGRQAFLTIIENVIRNAAKHGKDSLGSFNPDNPLTFSVVFTDMGSSYEIVVCDNKCNFGKVIDRFEKIGLISDNKINELNILNKDTSSGIDTSNKGIKEILICLAWLTNDDPYMDYSIIQNSPGKLVEIVGVDSEFGVYDIGTAKADHSLGYKFTIEKFKPVHIIDEEEFSGTDFADRISRLPAASVYAIPAGYENTELAKALTRVVTVKAGVAEGRLSAKLLEEVLEKNLNCTEMPDLVISERGGTKAKYKDGEKVIRENGGVASRVPFGDFIHYRNHYETEKVKNATSKQELEIAKGSIFTEGISGGNFTHNLIRTSIDELSYRYIVEAALTRIAIVDERVFIKYGGITPDKRQAVEDFAGNNHVDDIIEKVAGVFADAGMPLEGVDSDTLTRQILKTTKQIENYSFDGTSFIRTLRANRGEYEKSPRPFLKKMVGEYLSYNGDKISVLKYNPMYDYMEQKNITILNCDENGHLFDLNGNRIDKEVAGKFHFFSIHLSLLEKIVNGGDVKSALGKMVGRYNLGNAKISLHSGRGGLNTVEDVTFIPVSGIDWALDNCKYVLSELFYGLKYYPVEPIQ